MAKERGYSFRKAKAIVLDRLAGRQESEVREWEYQSRSGLRVAVFVTPGGGIPARSGATLGSATCTMYSVAGGTRASTSTTATVYSDVTSAIAGGVDIVAAKVNGIWLAIMEDCSGVAPALSEFTVDSLSVPP